MSPIRTRLKLSLSILKDPFKLGLESRWAQNLIFRVVNIHRVEKTFSLNHNVSGYIRIIVTQPVYFRTWYPAHHMKIRNIIPWP